MAVTWEQDEALTQLLLWVLVGEVALMTPMLVAVVVTVQRNYAHWLILRSRGIWYTRLLSVGPFVQFALSLSLALACVYAGWSQQSVALAVLGAVEETWLFFMTGVVIARQFILSVVFHTLPGLRKRSMTQTKMGPHHFLLVPLAVVVLWVIFGEIPQQLANFDILPETVTSTITYLATAAVVMLYAVPAFANRNIPMTLFCDYRANVFTFVVLVVVSIVVSCVNSIYLYEQGYVDAIRVARSCAYVFVVAMYTIVNFLMPTWAIWANDIAYLQLHEDAIREVKLIVTPDDSNATQPTLNALEPIVMERITVRLEAGNSEGSLRRDSIPSRSSPVAAAPVVVA